MNCSSAMGVRFASLVIRRLILFTDVAHGTRHWLFANNEECLLRACGVGRKIEYCFPDWSSWLKSRCGLKTRPDLHRNLLASSTTPASNVSAAEQLIGSCLLTCSKTLSDFFGGRLFEVNLACFLSGIWPLPMAFVVSPNAVSVRRLYSKRRCCNYPPNRCDDIYPSSSRTDWWCYCQHTETKGRHSGGPDPKRPRRSGDGAKEFDGPTTACALCADPGIVICRNNRNRLAIKT